MVDYKLFEETATGRFYKVYKDGVEVSRHYTEREAIESAQEVKFQYWNSDVKYVHEYEVEVGLTDAGITEAQDYGTPQDTPPTITSTPSPSFTVNGIEQTYDMTQHVSDDGVSAVTYELLNILPNGLSFDANTGVLTYDGIEGAQVSQHQLRATDAVGSATSNSFDITIAEAVGISDLSVLANSLSAGEWGELEGISGGSVLGGANHALQYADRGIYDPHKGIWWFYGSSDPPTTRGFYKYVEETNTFTQLSQPSWAKTGDTIEHSYKCHAIVPGRREMFYHQMPAGEGSWKEFDLDSEAWIGEPDGYDEDSNSSSSCDYFPARNSIVVFNGGSPGNPEGINEWNVESETWSYDIVDVPSYLTNASGNQHQGCEYSSIRIPGYSQRGCMVLYGEENNTLARMDPDLQMTRLDDYPGIGILSTRSANITMDPVSGKLICHVETIPQNGTAYSWELDPSAPSGSQWTRLLNIESGGIHTLDTVNGGICWWNVPARCDNYGVIMYVGIDKTLGTRIFVYKHTDAMTVDEVAADSDTLTALDFESEGRLREEEAFYIGPNNIAATDTTDVGGYIRNHPNAAYILPNGFNLNGVGFSGQVGIKWNMPWWFSVNANDPGPVWRYPRVIDGVGEFEDVTGTSGRSCMRSTIESSDGPLCGGELLLPLQRELGVNQTATTHRFYTAGAGSEIWIRYAFKVDANWAATGFRNDVGGGATGPKISNLHAMFTNAQLEETITQYDNTPLAAPKPFRMYGRANGSTEARGPNPTDLVDVADQWMVFHKRIVVSSDGGNDGIVEWYINEEETPFVSFSAAEHGGDGNLRTGWGFETTTGAVSTDERGFWRISFPTFITSKDGTPHATNTRWLDNIIIRKNTRCPPLRPGSTTGGDLEIYDTHFLTWNGQQIAPYGVSNFWITGDGNVDITTLFDAFSAHGSNLHRCSVMSHVVGKASHIDQVDVIYPFARSTTPGAFDGGNKFDCTQLNQTYLDRLTDIAREGASRGIIMLLIMWDEIPLESAEDSRWNANPFRDANNVNNLGLTGSDGVPEFYQNSDGDGSPLREAQELLFDAVLDVFKPYGNVIFSISNEYTTNNPADWHQGWHTRIVNYNAANGTNFLTNGMNYQGFDPTWTDTWSPTTNAAANYDNSYKTSQPVVSHKVPGSSSWLDNTSAGRAHWYNSFFFGAAGEGDDSQDGVDPPMQWTQEGAAAAALDQIKIFHDIIDTLPYNTMKPHQAIGTIANSSWAIRYAPDSCYAYYYTGTHDIRLDLSDTTGTYSVTWYDTITGVVYPDSDKSNMSANELFVPLTSNDVVLVLRKL